VEFILYIDTWVGACPARSVSESVQNIETYSPLHTTRAGQVIVAEAQDIYGFTQNQNDAALWWFGM